MCRGRAVLTVLLIALLVGFIGCTRYEIVEVDRPPRSGIGEGIERVGITDFEDSADRELGSELMFMLSDILINESPYTLIQTDMRADDYDLDEAREMDLDVLLTGTITHYSSDSTIDRLEYSEEDEEWSVVKEFELKIDAAFRMIEVDTGSILYSRRLSETQRDSETFTAGVDARDEAMETVRVYFDDETREMEERALESIKEEVFRDISPHTVRERVPVEED